MDDFLGKRSLKFRNFGQGKVLILLDTGTAYTVFEGSSDVYALRRRLGTAGDVRDRVQGISDRMWQCQSYISAVQSQELPAETNGSSFISLSLSLSLKICGLTSPVN